VWTDGNTIEGDANLTWDNSKLLLRSEGAAVSTTSPDNVSLGSTYSPNHPSVDDSSLKFATYRSGANYTGIGNSPNQLNFMSSSTNHDFVWYNSTTENMRLDGGTGNLSIAGNFLFDNSSEISAPVDGNILLTDDAGTDFGLLQFGN
jgi:hypothetical protein